MAGIKETLGIQTVNQTGQIAFGVMATCTIIVAADFFNIFDGVGLAKKTANKLAPSIFKADKFRTTTTPATK